MHPSGKKKSNNYIEHHCLIIATKNKGHIFQIINKIEEKK